MRRFSIQPQDIDGHRVTLAGDQANHLRNVLRLCPGDLIQLVDGMGGQYTARIQTITAQQVHAEILTSVASRVDPFLELIIAVALLKEKKIESLIRPLTELGMSRLIPFAAKRCIARPDAGRIDKRLKRWNKIAAESLKQCKRSIQPRIDSAVSFPELLDLSQSCDRRFLFYEDSKEAILLDHPGHPPVPEKIIAILGPEGGFTPKEIEQARQSDCRIVSLGPRILKAETAPIAACTLLQYLFGDMGNKLLDKPTGIH